MNIYIICPVRNASESITNTIRDYVKCLRDEGHNVHFPTDDVDQSDPTGESICRTHLKAMLSSHRVDIFWDVNSKGSHFDLGMAFALGIRLNPVLTITPDTDGKSYWKVINADTSNPHRR